MHYLTLHDKIWRVSMGVPRELRSRLGTRLVRSTGTASKAQAKLARDKIVPEFKKRIADAWAERGGKRGSLLYEALEFRRALEDATTPAERAGIIELLEERTREILDAGTKPVWVEADDEDPAMPIPAVTPEAKEEASFLNRVAGGKATPIGAEHHRYVESLRIKDRSKLDEPRALALLLDWLRLHRPHMKPDIENITRRVAYDFADWLDASTDLSFASKAKYFGRIKFYWAWMVKRQIAKENPFAGMTLQKPETTRADDERPYTDAEVQKLLMGSPMEGDRMRDVMMIAALTGARLDAVIDLKVGNLADGYFSFKAQKKERDGRDVPVHPDLAEIVARRIKGKSPEDDLFPEWPAHASTSKKPRSSYFSKRYTKYTSDIGVREEVEGHRRSKVNFHSWRRWFITKLERARVREPLIAAIVGHKRPGMTLGLYSGGPEFEEAREAIALVKLPPLDGSPVVEERSLMPRRR
jgi:hypothetical protein